MVRKPTALHPLMEDKDKYIEYLEKENDSLKQIIQEYRQSDLEMKYGSLGIREENTR